MRRKIHGLTQYPASLALGQIVDDPGSGLASRRALRQLRRPLNDSERRRFVVRG